MKIEKNVGIELTKKENEKFNKAIELLQDLEKFFENEKIDDAYQQAKATRMQIIKLLEKINNK